MHTCEACLRSFSRKDALKRHMNTVHSKEDVINISKRGSSEIKNENIYQSPMVIAPTTGPRVNIDGTTLYNDTALKWKHPFTCMIAGPTQCGKSTFTIRFLKHLNGLINAPISEVVYCAPKFSYPNLSECKTPVKYLDFIPDPEMFADRQDRLVIIDDMMRECDERIVDLFTKHSHHLSASVIFICQNVFHQNKFQRDISLNSHYIVTYKSPRDKGQFSSLARQICPGNTPYMNEIFEDATNDPYGYLVLDLTQTTPDHLRYRTKIFPDDKLNIIYTPRKYGG